MIITTTLTKVDIYEKDKAGKVLTYTSKKDGTKHRYKKIRIGLEDGRTAYGSIWNAQDSMNEWQTGIQVTINLEEKNGFLNFSAPKEEDYVKMKLEELEKRISKLEKSIRYEDDKINKVEDEDEQDMLDSLETSGEIDPEEIPF